MERSEIQNLKDQSRLLLKKQIQGISLSERKERSAQITQRLHQFLQKKSGKWGAFTPLSTEPQVEWLKVSRVIDWHFVQVNQDQLQFVNKSNSIASAHDLDGICIPALGFHSNGARLGRGGGYYDRELEKYKKNKIGVAFDFAVSDELPFESHDVKVDVIVTDRRLIGA